MFFIFLFCPCVPFGGFCSFGQPKTRQICFAFKLNTCCSIRSKFKDFFCQVWRIFWYAGNATFKRIYNLTADLFQNPKSNQRNALWVVCESLTVSFDINKSNIFKKIQSYSFFSCNSLFNMLIFSRMSAKYERGFSYR